MSFLPQPYITVLGDSPSRRVGMWSLQCLQNHSPSGTSITLLNCLLGTLPQHSQPVCAITKKSQSTHHTVRVIRVVTTITKNEQVLVNSLFTNHTACHLTPSVSHHRDYLVFLILHSLWCKSKIKEIVQRRMKLPFHNTVESPCASSI